MHVKLHASLHGYFNTAFDRLAVVLQAYQIPGVEILINLHEF